MTTTQSFWGRLRFADRAHRPARLLVTGLAAGLLALAPFTLLNSGYQFDLARLALYVACLTATWSLLAGVSGQFSFAHVALAGMAAYSGAIVGRDLAGSVPGLGNVWLSVLVGTLIAWAFGTGLGMIVLRLRGAYLALFTLGLAEITRIVVLAEVDLTGGALTLAMAQLPGGDVLHYYVVLAAFLLIMATTYAVIRSRIGLYLRAMREDADAASAMGVDTIRLKVLVFSLTSLLVGLAASVYFHTVPRVSPTNLDLLEMGLVVIYATVGGIESPLAGAIAAGGAVLLLEALRVVTLGDLRIEPGVWRYAIFGLFFIATLRLAPNGFVAPVVRWLAVGERQPKRQTYDGEARSSATATVGSEVRPDAEARPPQPSLGTPSRRAIDLRVEDVAMRFGGLTALDGVRFELTTPQICGLIGPNGAGKTTLVNILAGYYRPSGGAVLIRGERVDGLPPYELVRRGLGRTFQITRSFRRLTVTENLLVPELAVHGGERRSDAEARARATLEVVGLGRLADDEARSLSGGQQKLLEIARLLMLDTDTCSLMSPLRGFTQT